MNDDDDDDIQILIPNPQTQLPVLSGELRRESSRASGCNEPTAVIAATPAGYAAPSRSQPCTSPSGGGGLAFLQSHTQAGSLRHALA